MIKKVLFIFVTSVSATDFVFKPGPIVSDSKGEVWPRPQNVDALDNGYYTFSPSFFHFNNVGTTCRILEEALQRYRHLLLFNNRKVKEIFFTAKTCYFNADPDFIGVLTSFDVELTGSCGDDDYPFLEMKEEYQLTLSRDVRKLTSDTIWGILRGLETFSQLIYLTKDFSFKILSMIITCQHRAETIAIHDYPRLAHRGLLLDTSRHYHLKDDILQLLDTMSWNKLNVFHWHITDDYSFPYVSKTFPELSEKGAYHPTLMIYDQDFVQEVIEYARLRGIRVMIEFDTPGHTLSWGLGNTDLLTKCYNVPVLEWGPIDPTKNSSYTFIFKIYDEIKEVFKDKYVHIGGDEVDFSCWESNPEINRFMEEQGIVGDYRALQSMYTQKLIDYVTFLDLQSVVWEEVFTNGVILPTSTVINIWTSHDPQSLLNDVTKAGHPVIISSYWYLDQLSNGGDWLKFYNADPQDFPGTAEQKSLVIGAEACMWSEVVDSNNLESRVWPRASAAAERFWSAPGTPVSADDFSAVLPIAARLEEHTCRMNRRGTGAQPPIGPSVCF